MRKESLSVMMIGDVSGNSGKGALLLRLSSLKKEYDVDFVICNGENVSDGFGITIDDYAFLKRCGVDVITSGNHIWQKDEIYQTMENSDDILRPLNYPDPCVGKGYTIKKCYDGEIAVINLQGRIDLVSIDDPFKKAESIIRTIKKRTPLIFIDFHAENTEEKEALSFFLDGEVSAICGTHTHVQTRDEKILPKGTAYITDLGLTGYEDGVIGCDAEKSIERQLTQLPIKNEVAEGEGLIQGVIIVVDTLSGKAKSIKRFTR